MVDLVVKLPGSEDAKHIKNVPGRKTDVLDCQWIQQLHSYGLLRGSFRQKEKILRMRTLMRHRSMLIDYASSHVLHIQKALSLMNIQLKNVIRDVMGTTGMQIIRAIVEGERDPIKLAKYRDPKCKNSEDVIRESLIGNYQEEHLFCLKQALELYDSYAGKILASDKEIEKIIAEMGHVHLYRENFRSVENRLICAASRQQRKETARRR